LAFKCNEQAIDHLTIALKKNGKLFNESENAQENHIDILALLGKCYLELGNYEDALELLMKAYEMAKNIFEETD
jgi:tetratricopeptide (TPR) repeat protein